MESLILTHKNIRLQVEAKNWEEAVRIGGSLLVEQGAATHEYVDNIVKSIKELGPYIVVADGFAMPHTRPEHGALDIGCSLITLKNPVLFDGDKTPVKVMVCFSAIDNDSHLNILKLIVQFVEKDAIEKIASISEIDQLLLLIESI